VAALAFATLLIGQITILDAIGLLSDLVRLYKITTLLVLIWALKSEIELMVQETANKIQSWSERRNDERAAVQLSDVVLTFFGLVALLALAPVFGRFTDMITQTADPFSSILVQLIIPGIIIGILLSVGVSARRS
jgi:hypothetical protein